MTPRSTSISAYADLVTSGALNAKQRAVWGFLKQKDAARTGYTGRELDRDLGWTQDAHKRLSELKRAGVVTELEKRTCSVTGRKVYSWVITDKDPSTVTEEDLYCIRKPSVLLLREALQNIDLSIDHADRGPGLQKTLAWLRTLAT